MKLKPIKAGTYLVAVSGGVDSMVLIHLLQQQKNISLAIAHVNHGIRKEAKRDEIFVRNYARQHAIPFYVKRVALGPNASEDKARKVRHKFFDELIKEHGFTKLITAHHNDDIIETAIINMMRGTSWRGLVAMQSNKKILRPLSEYTKQDILDYAHQHTIVWVEDSTNDDTKYLRNFIRHTLLPNKRSVKARLKKIIEKQEQTEEEIRTLIASVRKKIIIRKKPLIISRYQCIMLPNAVLAEALRDILGSLEPQPVINKKRIHTTVQFIKTAQANKVLQIGGGWIIRSTPREIVFVKNR